MRQNSSDIPHLNYILWTCTYPVELVLGLAGYIAMIVADIPGEPTDRANHYFVRKDTKGEYLFLLYLILVCNKTL